MHNENNYHQETIHYARSLTITTRFNVLDSYPKSLAIISAFKSNYNNEAHSYYNFSKIVMKTLKIHYNLPPSKSIPLVDNRKRIRSPTKQKHLTKKTKGKKYEFSQNGTSWLVKQYNTRNNNIL